jgi:hypothetical protein
LNLLGYGVVKLLPIHFHGFFRCTYPLSSNP